MTTPKASTAHPLGEAAGSALYVTPPYIVDYILSDGRKVSAKVYDPTQGTGAFLLTAAKQLAAYCDKLRIAELTLDNPLAAEGHATLAKTKTAISDFERIMANPPFSAPNDPLERRREQPERTDNGKDS